MPRKRGISGRKAKTTAISSINIKLNKVNRRVVKLRQTGRYGTYASKGLNKFVQSNPHVYVSRRTKEIKVKSLDLQAPDLRLLNKVLDTFLNDPTSTNAGIQSVQAKINAGVRRRLEQYTDRDFTDQDLEDFYDLTHNEDFRYIADKIGDSELFVILDYVQQNQMDYDEFETRLKQYIDFPEANKKGGVKETGNSDIDKIAKRLYTKFMVGLE